MEKLVAAVLFALLSLASIPGMAEMRSVTLAVSGMT